MDRELKRRSNGGRKSTGIVRQRAYQIRWKDDEFFTLTAKAQARGMKVAPYIRWLVEKDRARSR